MIRSLFLDNRETSKACFGHPMNDKPQRFIGVCEHGIITNNVGKLPAGGIGVLFLDRSAKIAAGDNADKLIALIDDRVNMLHTLAEVRRDEHREVPDRQ